MELSVLLLMLLLLVDGLPLTTQVLCNVAVVVDDDVAKDDWQ